MKNLLFVLFCFLAVQPCNAGNEPVLSVPASDRLCNYLFLCQKTSARTPPGVGNWSKKITRKIKLPYKSFRQ